MTSRIVFVAALLAAFPAAAIDHRGEGRKTSARDLSLDVKRFELPNGLVVLLAPDASVSSVQVSMAFRAGTLYEPAERSGIAHLVEHILASGPTPDTDYSAIFERRRARYFNATTNFDSMQFDVILPADELPIAIWAAGDRLGSILPLVTDALVERNRKVVLEERALRDVDSPYGLVREHLFKKLYAAPHPLHGSVIGMVDELGKVTADDVRTFVKTLLVPANAILTVVGNFDPAEARRLIETEIGRLPPGKRAATPVLAPLVEEVIDSAEESVSHEPGVAIAWRFRVPHQSAVPLALAAQLFSYMTDGAWGMRVGAALEECEAESLFQLSVTVPYDEPAKAVQSDAEGFLRMLTRSELPLDLVHAANLALDRFALFDLETLHGRTRRVIRLERLVGPGASVAEDAAAHWYLDPSLMREVARDFLSGPRVVVHARPQRPRQARVGRR